jgi:hypothetical protein
VLLHDLLPHLPCTLPACKVITINVASWQDVKQAGQDYDLLNLVRDDCEDDEDDVDVDVDVDEIENCTDSE